MRAAAAIGGPKSGADIRGGEGQAKPKTQIGWGPEVWAEKLLTVLHMSKIIWGASAGYVPGTAMPLDMKFQSTGHIST